MSSNKKNPPSCWNCAVGDVVIIKGQPYTFTVFEKSDNFARVLTQNHQGRFVTKRIPYEALDWAPAPRTISTPGQLTSDPLPTEEEPF